MGRVLFVLRSPRRDRTLFVRPRSALDAGPAVVILRADPDLDAPLAALIELLAGAMRASFGDAVAVLHVLTPGERPLSVPGDPPDAIPRSWIAPPADMILRAALRAELDRHLRAGTEYVLIDPTSAGATAAPEIERLATHLVHFTREPSRPVRRPHPACDVLYVEVLPGPPQGSPVSPKRPLRDILVRGAVVDLVASSSATGGEGAAYPQARRGPRSCRVRLDFRSIARVERPSFRGLSASEKETFGRLARALTGRRVGLALGGSGAWGYASAALILELGEQGIPVDLVGGSSSGALIGAYHCAAGVEGIARVIERGPDFSRALPWMAVSSAIAGYVVDADLGGARLEELEVPLLPVATNLTHLRPEVICQGTVGFGVRASVSAPGVFAPTLAGEAVYVDGAITDNVPAGLVEAMGADLVIAANPLPAARPPSPKAGSRRPVLGGLGALAPSRRIRDLAVSFGLLMHLAGEREATSRRVVYSAAPEVTALPGIFDYAAAPRIVDQVRRRDPHFRQAIDAAVQAFRRLMKEGRRASPADTALACEEAEVSA